MSIPPPLPRTGVTASFNGQPYQGVTEFARALGLKPQQLLPGAWKTAWLTPNMVRRAARLAKRKATLDGAGVWIIL